MRYDGSAMSSLLLVRHGKASALEADYDNLSEAGRTQARLLGEHWAAEKIRIDAVYVGPRRRHRQTLDEVALAFRAHALPARHLPDAIPLDDLDEHHGLAVVMKAVTNEGGASDGEAPSLDAVLGTFKRITRKWARGEIVHDDIESWRAFRERVVRGVRAMTADAGRGKTIAAFTSAGAIAAAVGESLGIADETVLDLSWSLYNGSITELAFTESRWGLRTFNATPHLRSPELITAV
jgi:broad specificity phosphatase PhoE